MPVIPVLGREREERDVSILTSKASLPTSDVGAQVPANGECALATENAHYLAEIAH